MNNINNIKDHCGLAYAARISTANATTNFKLPSTSHQVRLQHGLRSEGPATFAAVIGENTHGIFVEIITSPKFARKLLFELAKAHIAHANKIPLIVNNTFGIMVGYMICPLDHGAGMISEFTLFYFPNSYFCIRGGVEAFVFVRRGVWALWSSGVL
ncbi:hypothetical protein B0H13DRAFT_2301558 [Mycena leptocephala]|nr:hypothetical protein B0H13DRAFT_2301558 [Mycena leptocephala]